MSQNQSYFWQTTKRNVYLKCSSKYRLMLALLSMLTFSTVCLAEIAPEANDGNGVVQAKEEIKMITETEHAFNNNINELNFIVSQSDQKSDSANTKSTISNVANLGFIHAFIASISVILVSELGDKTFFIAAIMAMRHARLTVFSGAIGALSLMTVLSAVFGMAATIIPRVYTYYISTALFAIFGLKMLKEGYYMKATDAQEELEEVQSDLRKREDELKRKANNSHDDNGAKSRRKNCNTDNSSDDFGSRLAPNSEMQHRQRKPPITAINNNNYASESDGESFKQSSMLLPKSSTTKSNDSNENGSTPKAISFNSSPCVAITTVTPDNNINHPKLESAIGSSIYSCIESIVEPVATNNFNNSLSKMDNAGHLSNNKHLNGMELKQVGSKNRLDREVSSTLVQDPESGVIRKNAKRSGAYMISRIFMQAFTMTFLAEWGDRSQLTTIILSAREDVYGVIVGGILGHTLCTGLAVIGGRMIAQKISVRTVTIIGGIVFLLFAITSIFMSPNEEV